MPGKKGIDSGKKARQQHSINTTIKMLGRRFSRLVVVDRIEDYIDKSSHSIPRYKCKCDCGNEKIVSSGNLCNGHVQSCGCLSKEVSGARFRKQVGVNNPKWRGGITKRSLKLRNDIKASLAEWRMKVFYRDEFRCQCCLEKEKQINAHHIVPFMKDETKRLDVDNGITLCIKCHRFTHKMGEY